VVPFVVYSRFPILFFPERCQISSFPPLLVFLHRTKQKSLNDGTMLAYFHDDACSHPRCSEAVMFNIHIEVVGDVAVVQCEGRIVHSEAAYHLRDAILSQRNARVVVVELSDVDTIEGGGLGMLAFLQRWAHDHNIKLKLFNPTSSVQNRLEHTWMPSLDVATADELIALLDRADQNSLPS
jgi:anti-anti-sigma regulatory factor